jgi:hypothetical protein
MEHFSPKRAESDGHSLLEYFLVRLYGQNWGSVKHRHFYKDEDPGGLLADAAMKRVQRVVNCYLDQSSDDLNTFGMSIEESDSEDIPLKDVNEVTSFENIFETLDKGMQQNDNGNDKETLTGDDKGKSAVVEDKSDADEPITEKGAASTVNFATTDVAEDKSAAGKPTNDKGTTTACKVVAACGVEDEIVLKAGSSVDENCGNECADNDWEGEG